MFEVNPYIESTKILTTKEKVGQLFMPAAFINDTEEQIQKLENLIQEHEVGSLCFFHSRASAATNFEGAKTIIQNAHSFETLKKLIQRYQKVAKQPLLIAIDAEWGLAMRIENTPQYPYAITLGAIPKKQNNLVFEVGKNIAKDCRKAGIHWNLAPCVDLNANPNNPVIGYRSFGADKHVVTAKALAFVKGTASEGILTSIKHFPGHGDTAMDSHLELPLISKSKQELLKNELYPFQKLIDEGIDSVMIGHLSVPALASGSAASSSISKKIIEGLLRTEMGYKGVVISDALNMHAVSKDYPTKGELEWLAFDAGNDVLCFPEHIAEGVEFILKNASEKQIEESFKRVWQLKEKVHRFASSEKELPRTYANPTALIPNTYLKNPDGLNRKIAMESLTLLKGSSQIITDFKATHFKAISILETTENQFLTDIYRNIKFTSSSLTDSLADDCNNVLLVLFPPQVKPNNSFGFSQDELIGINELIQIKNVVVYLFGNPYVLNHIDMEKAKVVVVAHQDFKVFQEIAAAHFLGNLEARGELASHM